MPVEKRQQALVHGDDRRKNVCESLVAIEDQILPKKCGHLNDKKLASIDDMAAKVAGIQRATAWPVRRKKTKTNTEMKSENNKEQVSANAMNEQDSIVKNGAIKNKKVAPTIESNRPLRGCSFIALYGHNK